MLNVGPCGNDRTEYHESKGEQGKAGNGTTKPEDLPVGNKDDGKVLEDGVYWNREELKRFRARVDHSNKKQTDREPLLCFICTEVTVRDQAAKFACLDRNNTNNGLSYE